MQRQNYFYYQNQEKQNIQTNKQTNGCFLPSHPPRVIRRAGKKRHDGGRVVAVTSAALSVQIRVDALVAVVRVSKDRIPSQSMGKHTAFHSKGRYKRRVVTYRVTCSSTTVAQG